SMFHLGWAQVLSRTSGRDDVVFGTVLFGRVQAGLGADRLLGLFINTLPIRIRIGEDTVEDSVQSTHALLGHLLRHEHAPLSLAQRCSAVPPPTPLFSAILNYRYARDTEAPAAQFHDGRVALGIVSRTNYPLVLSVDDLNDRFVLTADVNSSIDPLRICAFMHTAIEQLVDALERAPSTPLHSLDV